MNQRKININKAINEALAEEMSRDKSVILIGEDIGKYSTVGPIEDLYNKFGPKRVFDTPISETALTGLGIGAAISGFKPIIEIMHMDWATIALDQIVNNAAKFSYITNGKTNVPLTIRIVCGGGRGYGPDHSQSFESWLIHTPGLKVVAPSNPYDAKGLLKSAIRDGNPVVYIEHKLLYNIEGEVPDSEYIVPIGTGRILKEGKDATIVATLAAVPKAIKAQEILENKGINIELIDPRTLSPLDSELIINSVKKTGRLLVSHDAFGRASFSSEVIAQVSEKALDYMKSPPIRICSSENPVPASRILEKHILPSIEKIVTGVESMLK